MSARSSWRGGQSSKTRVVGPYLQGRGNRAAVARGPGYAPGKATRRSVAKVLALSHRLGGISPRLSARMAADLVLVLASAQSGSPGEGANFFPPTGTSGAWGQSRAGGTESGFARLGWRISLPLAGRSAGQERGSPLLVARADPPGPGLFRRGVTEAGKRKRRRQPSAARDGGRGLRVAFKVSRNPSAAGGGWRSARGFLGLWLLRFSHRCRFLTLGF